MAEASTRKANKYEVFKSHVGKIENVQYVEQHWEALRKVVQVLAKILKEQGFPDIDPDDPEDLDKFLYTIKDIDPKLSNRETWGKPEEVYKLVKENVGKIGDTYQTPRSGNLLVSADGDLFRSKTPTGSESSSDEESAPVPPVAGAGDAAPAPPEQVRDEIVGKEMPEDKLLQRTPPRKTESRLYKEFMKQFPFHPFSNEMGIAEKEKKKPMDIWKSDKVQDYLRGIWKTIQKNTSTEQVPMKSFGKMTGRDIQYLKAVAPDLTVEEAEVVYLSPTQYFMWNSLYGIVESRPIMTGSPGYLDLTANIKNAMDFKDRLLDVTFYLYKALKDNTPDGFKKMSVDSVNFDAIRIYVALAQMVDKKDVVTIDTLFREKPEQFKELVADSVSSDEFDIQIVEEGHGGAGAQLGEDEKSETSGDDDSARADVSAEDVALPDTDEDSESALAPDIKPQNNLATAAVYSEYQNFIRMHYAKYQKAISRQTQYDIFSRAEDIGARMKAVERASLVDGQSPDMKFQNWRKRIINP